MTEPSNVPLPARGAKSWWSHYAWLDAMVRWLAGRIDDVANAVPEPPDLSGYVTDADLDNVGTPDRVADALVRRNAGAGAAFGSVDTSVVYGLQDPTGDDHGTRMSWVLGRIQSVIDYVLGRPKAVSTWDDLVRAAQLGYSHTGVVFGDSTGDNLAANEWPLLVLKLLGNQYPGVRMEHFQWDDAGQAYGAVNVVNAGATPAGGVIAQDTFSAAGNAVGAAADTKGTWAGSGTFTKAAGVAAPATNAALSVLCPSQDSTVTSTVRVTTAGYAAPSRGHRFGNAFSNAGLSGFGVHAALVVGGATSTFLLMRKQTSAGLITVSNEQLDLGLNNVTDQVATVVTSLTGDTFTATITVGAKVTTRSITVTEAERAEMGAYAGVSNSPGNATAGIVWDELKVETAVIPTPTITIYNGSVAGKNPDYITAAGRVAAILPAQVDSVFMSFGHNGHLNQGGPAQFAIGYKAAIDAVRAARPAARFYLGSQNPEYSPRDASMIASHAARQALVAQIANENGAVYVPVWEAFAVSGTDNGRALVQADGVHPTNPSTVDPETNHGSSLWARVVAGTAAATIGNIPFLGVRRDASGWVRAGRFVSEIPGAPAQNSEVPRWDYVRDRIAEAIVRAQYGNTAWAVGGADNGPRPPANAPVSAVFAIYSFFTAPLANTITKLAIPINDAGIGLTLFRLGLCTVDSQGRPTLVARTANDPTKGETAGVVAQMALDTAGGFPASYTFVPGQRYAFVVRASGGTKEVSTGAHHIFESGQVAPIPNGALYLNAADIPTGPQTPGSWWNAPYMLGLA